MGCAKEPDVKSEDVKVWMLEEAMGAVESLVVLASVVGASLASPSPAAESSLW